ncbi:MAG: acetyl-CoA carboxylase biotin carboxyl carrier protein [bacterium]|nr:acetyl-CoA carboxylase biotin carboxyl carrier protein [bacterium]
MNEAYIKKLIKLVEESEIDTLEVSHWGRKIKITQKSFAAGNGHSSNSAAVTTVAAPVSTPAGVPAPAAKDTETPAATIDRSKGVAITAPMVGTFYAAPAPDADPYVSVNAKVRVGQVVCILEAMKLMNEIESEVSGRVIEILAENGKPVEFGQELFLIEPE